MSFVRVAARPLLGAIFVLSGADTLMNPDGRTRIAEPFVKQVAAAVPVVPDDAARVVRLNALTHLGAGVALATGFLPRLAAAVLAGSLVPTTIGGHRFWELEDPSARAQQRTHFLKNLAILGGLLIAALD